MKKQNVFCHLWGLKGRLSDPFYSQEFYDFHHEIARKLGLDYFEGNGDGGIAYKVSERLLEAQLYKQAFKSVE